MGNEQLSVLIFNSQFLINNTTSKHELIYNF